MHNWSIAIFIYVDTTPPTGFATTGPPRRTNKPRATFAWRTSENSDFKCYLDDQNPIDCGEGDTGQHTTNPLPDGDHDFSVVATDNLGNKAPVVNSTWTVGRCIPTYDFCERPQLLWILLLLCLCYCWFTERCCRVLLFIVRCNDLVKWAPSWKLPSRSSPFHTAFLAWYSSSIFF